MGMDTSSPPAGDAVPRTSLPAGGLAVMLEGLAAAHSCFAKWNWQGDTLEEAQTPFCTMPPQADELTELLAGQEDGGEMISAWNGIDGPQGGSFRLMSGMVGLSHPLPNVAEVQMEPSCLENADVQNAPVLKAMLGTVVAAWKADWGIVEPYRLPEVLGHHYRRFRGGWITFLAAPFLPLIVPPRSAILERGPDDGLLLIATEERFCVDNPSHVAVARDICAALAPLN